MIPRLIFLLSVLLGPVALGVLFLYGGHGKVFDTPLSGWRTTAWNYLVWTTSPLLLLSFGYVI